jgi:hypothetical protein
MKKLGLLLVFLLTLGAAQSFAFGIGVAYTPWFGLGDAATQSNGVALSVKFDQTPFLFGIGATIGGSQTNIGLTGDVWMNNGQLIEFLNYYIGLGFYGQIITTENDGAFDLGGRLPIGINAYLLKTFEFFLEIAPTVGVGIGDPIRFPAFNIQGAVGIRAWF